MRMMIDGSEQREAPGPQARFGQVYDELARLAGVPLWADLPDAQRLAIVAAAARARESAVAASDDEYLTSGQVAKLLGVSVTTVAREIAAGRLPVVLVRDRSRRVRRTALDLYVANRTQAMGG